MCFKHYFHTLCFCPQIRKLRAFEILEWAQGSQWRKHRSNFTCELQLIFSLQWDTTFYLFTAVKYSFFKICIIFNQYFPVLHYFVYNEKDFFVIFLHISRSTDLDVSNISEEKLSCSQIHYWDMKAYNLSKLCNVLFSMHLNKLLSAYGVTSLSLHPGNIMWTSLQRNWWFYKLIFYVARPFTKSMVSKSRPRDCKTFSMLNLAERDIHPAHKC